MAAEAFEPSYEKGLDWRFKGACNGEDPELFFPVGESGPARLQIDRAKAICRSCAVLDACLKFALDNGEDSGVWGGLSEKERSRVKRRNTRVGPER